MNCQNCKHWKDENEHETPGHRSCEVLSLSPRGEIAYIVVGRDRYRAFFTSPDFGCVLFEAPVAKPLARDPMDLVVCDTYGCQNLKQRDAIFCRPCGAEYAEDPDAFK